MLLEHPLAGLERGPGDRDAGATHPAPEENPHVHVGTALEANRLERHAHLDGVALCIPAPAAVPYVVRRLIFAARHGVEHIELHAVGIDHQVIGELPGAERVEADADPVVGPDVVAARDRGLDGGRVGIVALEREVQVVGVVPDPDLGLLGNCRAVQRVVGLPLARLEWTRAPGIVVEYTVDGWGLRYATRVQRGFDRRGLGRLCDRRLRLRPDGRRGDDRESGDENRPTSTCRKRQTLETDVHKPLDGATRLTVAKNLAPELLVQSFSAISTFRASSNSCFFSLVKVGYLRFRSLSV